MIATNKHFRYRSGYQYEYVKYINFSFINIQRCLKWHPRQRTSACQFCSIHSCSSLGLFTLSVHMKLFTYNHKHKSLNDISKKIQAIKRNPLVMSIKCFLQGPPFSTSEICASAPSCVNKMFKTQIFQELSQFFKF